MSQLGSLEATVAAALATLGPERSVDPLRTVTPQRTYDRGVLDLLATADRYTVGRTLGEGGMGVVHLAQQRTLGRDVAIKTLKEDVTDPKAVMGLLQEAWVTGVLEHPNIVPVYDIDRDDAGRPRIILKKIEGDEWAALMFEADLVERKFGADDLLEWNIRILIEVCQALRFAHSRGFVHRDLKPANVMVGAFGEVYVLDWGIAVALQDDGSGRFPLAKDATQIAGTPSYLSPEQLGGPKFRISLATDVYLIGGMLFELLSQRPPHRGGTLGEIFASVVRSPPRLPEGVPGELAKIVERAMAADPSARFGDAAEFQLALEAFLRHRGSRQLTDQANLGAIELQQAIEQGDYPATEECYAECTFAYQAALKAWRDNESARQGLARVTALRIEHELDRGEPGVAERFLAVMDNPPAELIARVGSAQDRARHLGEAYERLRENEDEGIGQRTRLFLGSIVTLLWTLAPLSGYLFELNLAVMATCTAGFALLLVAMGLWARESLMRTRLNRQLGAAALATIAMQLLGFLGGWLQGLDFATVESLMVLSWAVSMAFVTIIKPSLWPALVGFIATFVAVSLVPEQRYLLMSAGNGCLMVTVLWQDRAGAELSAE